jgi:hypothetical protein
MPGNPLVRFDEGRVGRIERCRLLSYSTVDLFLCGHVCPLSGFTVQEGGVNSGRG